MNVKQFSKTSQKLMLDQYIAEREISEGAEKLLRFVLASPFQRPVKITELAKNLKMSRQSIYTYYEELEKKGVLEGNGNDQKPPKKK